MIVDLDMQHKLLSVSLIRRSWRTLKRTTQHPHTLRCEACLRVKWHACLSYCLWLLENLMWHEIIWYNGADGYECQCTQWGGDTKRGLTISILVQKGPCVGSNCMCLVTWRLSNLQILCEMAIPTTRYWLIHSAFITERISHSHSRERVS